jgi:hypothetical protein
MTLAPRVRPFAMAPFVGPHSIHGYYGELMDNSATAVSAAWPSAQRAFYFPLIISQPCIAYRFFWLNGATVGTDNLQVGLYNDNDSGDDGPGTSIVLGTSTLSAGANICQFDNIADTAIPARRIWLAMWGNGTTATVFRHAPSNTLVRVTSGYIQGSLAAGLPATATPAQNTFTGFVPIFGFTTIATP